MKDKTKLAVWMLVRIASALAIGHAAFFFLVLTLRLGTGLVASEIGCLCLSTLAFYMLKVRHWRFWVAVAIGVVLWFATMWIQVYTDPLYDGACGYTRYFGLPLPAHRSNECSTGYSIIADGKPGRSAMNLLFWCFVAYALVIAPRIVRWFREAWRSHRKCVIVSVAVLLAAVAWVIGYRREIAENWYAPRDWQSPRGYRRLPRELWPERTWWDNVKSYF
ncbi:MAG: hypothetical protein E7049_01685 [Lentisphaerae bacterium]|nr:hypothetical protein [Lentisphaerota bacterium]